MGSSKNSFSPPTNPSTGWNRTTFGTPDLAHINRFEFHADTWGGGFQYWLDGVSIAFNGGARVTSIRNAKLAADNTRVDLTGAIVSVAWPDVFYIESSDRTKGIRVEKAGHALVAGQTARKFGYVKTNPDGERTIDASWAMADGGSGTITSLGMANKQLGGANWNYSKPTGAGQRGVTGGNGLNNIGLLVRTFGKVVAVDGSVTPTWYTIDDGSNVNVKVVVQAGVGVPAVGSYVTVTGASSIYLSGSSYYRQVLAQ